MGLALPAAVVNIFLLVALVVMTGALHLDGFLDTCDGLGGHGTPEERWRIMDDSRAGGFGVVGVTCLLLTKYIVLNSIPASMFTATLILMPVISRWAMVYAIFAYPYAKPAGLGKTLKEGTDWRALTMATVVAIVVAMMLGWWVFGLTVLVIVWIVVVLAATYLKSKFAGLTGDTYGAINEISEVAVLVLATLLAHNRWLNLT
jgi:adenosylcobinamide-GDP ribazoletransferase